MMLEIILMNIWLTNDGWLNIIYCMDKKLAKKLVDEWEKRLGIDDWVIILRVDCLPSDFQLSNVAGETEWDEVGKSAVVKILDERCYGERIVSFDFEKILVHELLHIKFSLIQETGDETHDRIVHQYIDDLAKALVDAKRCNK